MNCHLGMSQAYHIEGDEHPFSSYFHGVHQGCRSLSKASKHRQFWQFLPLTCHNWERCSHVRSVVLRAVWTMTSFYLGAVSFKAVLRIVADYIWQSTWNHNYQVWLQSCGTIVLIHCTTFMYLNTGGFSQIDWCGCSPIFSQLLISFPHGTMAVKKVVLLPCSTQVWWFSLIAHLRWWSGFTHREF